MRARTCRPRSSCTPSAAKKSWTRLTCRLDRVHHQCDSASTAGLALGCGDRGALGFRGSRAKAKTRGVEVRILSDCQCLCTTMYRIDQPHLLWVLDNLVAV